VKFFFGPRAGGPEKCSRAWGGSIESNILFSSFFGGIGFLLFVGRLTKGGSPFPGNRTCFFVQKRGGEPPKGAESGDRKVQNGSLLGRLSLKKMGGGVDLFFSRPAHSFFFFFLDFRFSPAVFQGEKKRWGGERGGRF